MFVPLGLGCPNSEYTVKNNESEKMTAQPLGIPIEDVFPLNVRGKYRVARPEQPSNASHPMLVTPFGTVTDVSPEQS